MRKLYKRTVLTGCFLLILHLNNFAGPGKSSFFSLSSGGDSAEYVPNTIIFKLKPGSSTALNSILSSVEKGSVNRRFPKAKSSFKHKNAKGRERVDLSLIYELTFSGNDKIENVIDKLKANKNILYAEPKYINKPLYTPNDPSTGSQYYLDLMKVYQAWDISKGDTNVVIGITDTGFDLTHPDLVNSIKYNYKDPIDGIDNDGDKYIDNFRGWDVGNNDNNPSVDGADHGVYVSGLASATTDNAVGMAGPGFKCKFMPIKIESGGQLMNELDGIVYAAEHGCQIINCSWGHVGGASQYEQDVIDYATKDFNCLIVAAAGNNNNEGVFYPASYNNVISVAASDVNDKKGTWTSSSGPKGSNYGYNIDVCAPGVNVYTTQNNGNYLSGANGTSFACPVASGCAAIIKSQFPAYTGVQVGERLRATCDFIDTVSGNAPFIGKLGRGRINLFRAVTEVTPSIRMAPIFVTDRKGDNFLAGDTMDIWGVLFNYLDPASNLTVTLTTASSDVVIVKGSVNIGGLNTLSSFDMINNRFKVKMKSDMPLYTNVLFKITYSDGTYIDYQYFQITLNPDYVNLAINNITTSITSNSLIGYNKADQIQGKGFSYNKSASMLFAGGLMLSAGTKVVDNLYGVPATTNNKEFVSVSSVKEVIPSIVSDRELMGKFNDSLGGVNKIGVLITNKAFAWKSALDSNYVIVEYTIKNINSAKIDSLYAGLFLDWDIDNSNRNRANFDTTRKMGYAYSNASSPHYAGVKLLTNEGSNIISHAIENDGSSGSINIYDGFSKGEKNLIMKNNRLTAGTTGTGKDISIMVAAGPFMVAAGDSVKVAFALIGGKSLTTITDGAIAADIKYNKPVITASKALSICQGDSVKLTSSRAKSYKWSNGETAQSIFVKAGGTYSVAVPGSVGNELTSNSVTINVSIPPKPTVTPNGALTFCPGGSVTLSSTSASQYLWSDNATTQNIIISKSGNFSVTIKDSIGCAATSSISTTFVDSMSKPTISTSGSAVFCPGNSVTLICSNANSYVWSNGLTTQSIKVSGGGDYSVIAKNASGCSATSSIIKTKVDSMSAPSISTVGSIPFCPGSFVTLTCSSANSYAWSNGATTPSIKVSKAGTYSVTAKNATGCSASSSSITTTVYPIPATPTITTTGSTSFCLGDSVKLASSTGTSYKWSNGATAQIIFPKISGNYSVSVSDANGCSASSTAKSVTAKPLPVAKITANSPTTFCEGGNVSLVSALASSYNWSNGAKSQGISVTVSGNYQVTIKGANGCSATSAITSVTVDSRPLKPLVLQTNNILTSSIVAAKYQWFLNAVLIPGAILDTHQIINNGLYKVQITDIKGCSNESDQYNVINMGIEIPDPEIFSLHQNIPNPSRTSTAISFDIAKKTNLDLSIYNLLGQKMMTVCNGNFSVGSYNYTVDLSTLTDGIYYYQLSAQGKFSTRKLMISKN